MIKTLNALDIQEADLNTGQATYTSGQLAPTSPWLTAHRKEESWSLSLQNLEEDQYAHCSRWMQCGTGSPGQSNQARGNNKGRSNWTEGSIIITGGDSTFSIYGDVGRRPQKFHKKFKYTQQMTKHKINTIGI